MIILQAFPPIISFLNSIGGKIISEKILRLITKGENFFYQDKIFDFEVGELVPRLLLLLPGKGCEWALKTGGCTMCGFPQKTKAIGQLLNGEDLVALTKIALLMSGPVAPYNITVFNGGSFLNHNEISNEAQKNILNLFVNMVSVQKIFLESRAEFITDEAINLLTPFLKSKKITIGIGLEAQDDRIRNKIIRKGMSKKTFEKSVNLLKKNDIRVLSYVLLKPIYLDEKEAIEEAVKTIEYAFSVGSDEVALESTFVQEKTVMEKLFKEGKFRPPWLWSIIEVIKRTRKLGPVHIGSFNDEPPPIAIPQNCPKCSKQVEQAIDKYRQTYNISYLESLDCSCREEWLKEIGAKF